MKEPKSFPFVEICLIYGLILAFLFVFNDYVAFFLSVLIILVNFSIIVISWIAEKLDRSKIPSWYFPLLWTLIMISIVSLVVFGSIYGFHFDWMK
ncbi:MAG: hypothetical protein IPK88_14550 [Saprospiraceae bacterium]|nr:hypothetical protein [Candidatus Defluviibacterium haderslevense]